MLFSFSYMYLQLIPSDIILSFCPADVHRCGEQKELDIIDLGVDSFLALDSSRRYLQLERMRHATRARGGTHIRV